MSYIRSKEHLVNYVNKILHVNDFSPNDRQIITREELFEHVYDKGFADRFSWDFKANQDLAYVDEFYTWVDAESKSMTPSQVQCLTNIYTNYTNEFSDLCYRLINKSGVYCFCDNDEIVYVGVSKNLGQRLPSSFKRYLKIHKQVYVRYFEANVVDAHIYEAYIIGRIKPKDNKHLMFEVAPTVYLEVPEWSDAVCVREFDKETMEEK